jgi:hypothetical protein
MRTVSFVAVAATVAALTLSQTTGAQTSQAGRRAGARSSAPGPTAWGDPDLQGIWTNTTTTPFERPDDLAGKATLSAEELRTRNAEVADRVSFDRPTTGGNVGAYNEFWMERGKLNNRTSLIIDPPDGKMPGLTDAGRKRAEAIAAARKERPADSWEDRSAYDRCITRSMPGAMMPGFYNHNYQILQTPGFVAIAVEMIHDVRIIPLDGRPHLNDTVRLWLGDSRGHWEGKTLVVETTNLNDNVFETRPVVLFGTGRNSRVVERFTRVDDETLDYQYTVHDPTTYTRPFTVSTPMLKIPGPLYEYACHEGNYAMPHILAGARSDEKKPADARKP